MGSVGAGVHRAVLEQVFTGQCWSGCSVGTIGAGVQWAVLEQVFSGQCWGRCSLVIRAVLEQVFTVHLASVRPGVHWTSGQC